MRPSGILHLEVRELAGVILLLACQPSGVAAGKIVIDISDDI